MPKKFDSQRKVHRPFFALPTELIEGIGVLLEAKDLCSLRLTCKLFYQATIYHFGRTCLHCLETDLSLNSLDRIAVISQNQQLRHYVHHLSMNGIYPNFFGQGFTWDRHSSGRLLFPQPGIQKLQDILTLLANCSSFHICSVNLWEDTLESDSLGPTDVVTIILNIVAETGLPVRSFSVDFKTPNLSREISADARRLYMPDPQTATFATAWSHLRELSVRQDLELGTANWVTELVIHAPSLQKLTIDFDYGDAAESVIHRLSSADSLPQLQQLNLGRAGLEREEHFLDFLHRFRHSLHTLYLRSISLNVDAWKPVLASLSNDLVSLESIRLMALRARYSSTIQFPALLYNPFVNESHGRRFIFSYMHGREKVIWVGYTGPNMNMALQTLLKHAEIPKG